MARDFTDIFKTGPKMNGKAHADAPYPAFKDEAINESEFEHENRCKWATYTDYDVNYANLDWMSQEYNYGDYDKFKAELTRYYRFMAKKYKLDRDFCITVYLHDRDGEGSIVFDIDIKVNE